MEPLQADPQKNLVDDLDEVDGLGKVNDLGKVKDLSEVDDLAKDGSVADFSKVLTHTPSMTASDAESIDSFLKENAEFSKIFSASSTNSKDPQVEKKPLDELPFKDSHLPSSETNNSANLANEQPISSLNKDPVLLAQFLTDSLTISQDKIGSYNPIPDNKKLVLK